MTFLKIGELASLTGITVRTLHYYDEINLLSPHHSKDNGQRFYGKNEIERLGQIISLKNIGLGLKDIAQILEHDSNLVQTLNLHHQVIQKKLSKLEKIECHLALVLKELAFDEKDASFEKLLSFMKEITQMEQWNEFYTPEQVKKLKDRCDQYSLEAKRVEKAWPLLFKEFNECHEQGLSIDDPKVQELAKKAQHFIDLFTGKDKEIEKNMDKAYQKQQNRKDVAVSMGVSEDIFNYADSARKLYNEKLKSKK